MTTVREPNQDNTQLSSTNFQSSTGYYRAIETIIFETCHELDKWRSVAIQGDGTEGIHRSRVNLRRFRTVLKISRGYFHPQNLHSSQKNLKFISTHLSPARDLDVFRERMLASLQPGQTEEDFNAQVWRPHFAEISERSYQRARELLKSHQFDVAIKQLKMLEPLQFSNNGQPTLSDVLPSLLSEQANQINQFQYLAEPNAPGVNFHRLRLQIKKHRYTLMFFTSVLSPAETKKTMTNLKVLQELLGGINDCDVGQDFIKNSITENITSQALIDYSQRLEQDKINLIKAFPEAWESYRRRRTPKLIVHAHK